MKITNIICIAILLITTSCNWAKEKGKDAANKTIEAVAKTGSEIVDGVVKGIEETFSNEVVVSDILKQTA